MENPTVRNPKTAGSALARHWPWLLVLFAVLFSGYIRVRLLSMPLERDEGEYAYAGQLLLQGIPPYELAYNMKLPGTYFICAAGMALFGTTDVGLHLTLLVAGSLTIVFVFLLGRKLFGPVAGVVAAVTYAVMSISPAVAGLAAHANHFVVLFAVPATLVLLSAVASGSRKGLLVSGLLYGLAFLMKQQGICFGLFGGLLLAWHSRQALFTAEFFRRGLWFGAGILLPFGVTCLYLAVAGVFPQFWFWTFTYAHSYVASTPWPEGVQNLASQLKLTFDLLAGFWLIAVLAIPLALITRRSRRELALVVGFGLCSFLGTAMGLYFRPHYFILSLPAFALLVGAGIALLQQLRPRFLTDVFKTLPLLLLALVLSWFVYYQAQIFFEWSADAVVQNLYRMNPFLEARTVAGYLRAHSTSAARIAVIGSEPEVYFYAQRHSATGVIYTYPLMEDQPNAVVMQRQMISEIETNRPEYIVHFPQMLSWLTKSTSDRTIFTWLTNYSAQYYEPVGVVGPNARGQTEYLWDDALKARPRAIQPGDIVIYKRRPQS